MHVLSFSIAYVHVDISCSELHMLAIDLFFKLVSLLPNLIASDLHAILTYEMLMHPVRRRSGVGYGWTV